MPRIKKKILPENFTPLPKSKRDWDVYSKTLIHSTILEVSKGGSWKSIGRFAYQFFVIGTATRDTRAGAACTKAHSYHRTKGENWKLFTLVQSTHRYSFRLGHGS